LLKKVVFLITGLTALLGGIIWLCVGFKLSMLPPGNPGYNLYRNSQLFMPWFGYGMACIGIGLVGLYVSAKGVVQFAQWSLIVSLIGSFLYLFGTISRLSMNLSVQYEAAQPIGFLMTIFGILFFNISLLRSKLLPSWCRVLLILSVGSLLIFNDQFITSWSSVPFGISWIGLSVYLFMSFFQGAS
jgi:hypothetical protein